MIKSVPQSSAPVEGGPWTLVAFVRSLVAFAPKRLGWATILAVVLGLLEGVGILLVVPLLALAGILEVPGLPAGTGSKADWLGPSLRALSSSHPEASLGALLSLYVAIIAGHALLHRYHAILTAGIHHGFKRALEIRLYRSLCAANWRFLVSRRKADIAHLLITEVSRVHQGVYHALSLLALGLTGGLQVGLAFAISPPLTTIVLAGGLFVAVVLTPYVRAAKSMGGRLSTYTQRHMVALTEHLNGMKEIKTTLAEQAHIEAFDSICCGIEREFVAFQRLQSKTDVAYKVGAALLASAYLYVGIQVLAVTGTRLLVVLFILARLWPKLSTCQSALQQLAMMLPSFSNLQALEQECVAAREHIGNGSGTIAIVLRHELIVQKVRFRHGTRPDGFALVDVDLHVPAGSIVALTGHSGAGKSTLADIVIGLLQPDRGTIIIDGLPLTPELLPAWRRAIGYVPQDAFLLNASVRENLLMADTEASDAALGEALAMAAALELIDRLPDGLETIVGDRGVRLSGGERQRIVLARALLRKPTLLVLDEATSALDSKNEWRILETLEQLRKSVTILLIAHRASTLKAADTVYVLAHGRIVRAPAWHVE